MGSMWRQFNQRGRAAMAAMVCMQYSVACTPLWRLMRHYTSPSCSPKKLCMAQGICHAHFEGQTVNGSSKWALRSTLWDLLLTCPELNWSAMTLTRCQRWWPNQAWRSWFVRTYKGQTTYFQVKILGCTPLPLTFLMIILLLRAK